MNLFLELVPRRLNYEIRAIVTLKILLFSTLSFAQNLPQLINNALLSHPNIASQKAQAQAAELGIETAKWQYFPTPSISAERVGAGTRDPFYSGDKNVTTVRLQQP
jgi:adhesin transport system outer membrane protein